MPNRAPYIVTTTVSQLTTGLTAGATYTAQHVGGDLVEYCNYATDPTDVDIAWNLLPSRLSDFIIFEAATANPVWVRTMHRTARLAINEQ